MCFMSASPFTPNTVGKITRRVTFANDGTANTSGLATHTFTAHALGAADKGRKLILCIGIDTNNARTITGVTVGGVAATLIVASASSTQATAIFLIENTDDTSADIVVTFSGTVSNSFLRVINTVNMTDENPTTTDTLVSTATSIGLTVDRPGSYFMVFVGARNTLITSWNNLTRIDQEDFGSGASVLVGVTDPNPAFDAGDFSTNPNVGGTSAAQSCCAAIFR